MLCDTCDDSHGRARTQSPSKAAARLRRHLRRTVAMAMTEGLLPVAPTVVHSRRIHTWRVATPRSKILPMTMSMKMPLLLSARRDGQLCDSATSKTGCNRGKRAQCMPVSKTMAHKTGGTKPH